MTPAPSMLLLGLGNSLQMWLAPVWLLALGTTAGLAIVLVPWFVVGAILRRPGRSMPPILREGPLFPITIVLGAMALLAVFGGFGALNSEEMLQSLARLPQAGTRTIQETIPAGETAAEIPVNLLGSEVSRLVIASNADVRIQTSDPQNVGEGRTLDILADNPYDWQRTPEGAALIGESSVPIFYVINEGEAPAEVQITITTAPAIPQVVIVPIAAVSVAAIYLLYILQRLLLPKISAIALATCKSEMSQPLFAILLLVGIAALLVLPIVPYHTFGEDIKMFKDSSLTLIMILSIVMAVWAASESISEELEGKTALTILSKPVSRRSFIIGKFLGICWTVAVMFVVLGTLCLLVVAFKPIYDSREMSYKPLYDANDQVSAETLIWQDCYSEMVKTVPGLVLAYFEAAVMAAISVAMSTRLPMLANFLVAATVYVVGHLTPLIVKSQVGEFEPVAFAGRLVATVFPALDHFNIYAAISGGRLVPLSYLAFALLYCVLYCSIALLVALVLFEDRDLA